MHLGFEWDEIKARENLRKHRVRFEEAKTIFNDPMLLTFPDTEHSMEEHRSISIGLSIKHALLLVVHTERSANVRIISARKATAEEQRTYETF
jgi:uncharacterized protein